MSAVETPVISQAEPIARIRDLHVDFDTDAGVVEAVRGVDLEIRRGEVLAIVGESGSGKTMTARSLLRLLPETATLRGSVMLAHRDSGDSTEVVGLHGEALRTMRGQDAAMVFQEPSSVLNPVFPIGWQIAEGMRAHGRIGRAEARRRAIEILGEVGIPDPERRVDAYPHEFSGGQKQRVVIAMALVLRPGLIIADEPTTALDVTVQAEILELLRRCRDDFGASILLITHNMGVVADLADRVAVMHEGLVVEHGEVHEVFAHPREEYTRDLLAAVPRIGSAPPPVDRTDAEAEPAVASVAAEVTYPGRFGGSGFRAVRGVTFTIRQGEVLGLVGESGSGKSTIGRAIAGLTDVTGGSLRVLGHEMLGFHERRFRPVRGDLGFVFQDPAASFDPQRTIGECIAEPLIVHGRAKDARDAGTRVAELLDAVRLPAAYAERFPHELSGGQRQRVSLARALALDPKLLIADEPTSALDVSVQARVLELFRSLQEELGFACLFITHDLAVVDRVAHSVAVLYHGEIVEHGVARDVLTHPVHAYTRRLLDSLPVADPEAQRARRAARMPSRSSQRRNSPRT